MSIKGLKGIDVKKEVYVSLFDNSKNLTDFEYWLQMLELDRKYNKENIKPTEVIDLLSDFLDKKVEIMFDGSNILFTENETELNFSQLSDGYRSSITWISDLLARLSNNQGIIEYKDYIAIVLVDEI